MTKAPSLLVIILFALPAGTVHGLGLVQVRHDNVGSLKAGGSVGAFAFGAGVPDRYDLVVRGVRPEGTEVGALCFVAPRCSSTGTARW